MRYITQTTNTVYHSRDWEHLVSLGWITMTVEWDEQFGYRCATMLRQTLVPDPFGRW